MAANRAMAGNKDGGLARDWLDGMLVATERSRLGRAGFARKLYIYLKIKQKNNIQTTMH